MFDTVLVANTMSGDVGISYMYRCMPGYISSASYGNLLNLKEGTNIALEFTALTPRQENFVPLDAEDPDYK
jgi:hypothetical protein